MSEGPAHNTRLFILAGGKSSRMGTDKAFLEWEGSTFLERALLCARSITPHVTIVGSRDKFESFAPVIEDKYPDRGPLGGIHAALADSSAEQNSVLAVDLPLVPPAFLSYLLEQAIASPTSWVVIPRSSERLQPLCAVYRREFGGVAENALRAGRNRIDVLFHRVPIRVIEESELKDAGFSPSIFRNLNTPQELESARTSHSRS